MEWPRPLFRRRGRRCGESWLKTPGGKADLNMVRALVGRKIIKIAAGYEHSLILADDGSVFGFGKNTSGQLGLGVFGSDVPVATPINTSMLDSA